MPLQDADLGKDECWSSLLLGSMIAREYPVPIRGDEKGLELPFHLMITLAGPVEPRLLEGGIYFEGYSRLLFPTEEYPVSGFLQWHFTAAKIRRVPSEESIYYYDWAKIRDPGDLAGRRTFLGHYERAVVDLGTREPIRYYKNIENVVTHTERHRSSLAAPSAVNLGTSGLGFATLEMNFPISKGLTRTMEGQNDDYWDVLELRSNKSVILYDDCGRRAWMVPVVSVILHMIYAWAAHSGHFKDQMPFAELSDDPGETTKDFLTRNWNVPLRDTQGADQSSRKIFKDLVMKFWKSMRDRQLANLRPESHVNSRSCLYGWNSLDIVLDDYSERKEIAIGGKWTFLAHNVLVLCGRNFGEVIKPANEVTVCQQWNPVPHGMCYLVATIRSLQYLSSKHSPYLESLKCRKLTDKAYWNPEPNDLFANCTKCLEKHPEGWKRCSKKAQVLQSCFDNKGKGPLSLPLEGAVIFNGDNVKLRKSKIPTWTADAAEREGSMFS